MPSLYSSKVNPSTASYPNPSPLLTFLTALLLLTAVSSKNCNSTLIPEVRAVEALIQHAFPAGSTNFEFAEHSCFEGDGKIQMLKMVVKFLFHKAEYFAEITMKETHERSNLDEAEEMLFQILFIREPSRNRDLLRDRNIRILDSRERVLGGKYAFFNNSKGVRYTTSKKNKIHGVVNLSSNKREKKKKKDKDAELKRKQEEDDQKEMEKRLLRNKITMDAKQQAIKEKNPNNREYWKKKRKEREEKEEEALYQGHGTIPLRQSIYGQDRRMNWKPYNGDEFSERTVLIGKFKETRDKEDQRKSFFRRRNPTIRSYSSNDIQTGLINDMQIGLDYKPNPQFNGKPRPSAFKMNPRQGTQAKRNTHKHVQFQSSPSPGSLQNFNLSPLAQLNNPSFKQQRQKDFDEDLQTNHFDFSHNRNSSKNKFSQGQQIQDERNSFRPSQTKQNQRQSMFLGDDMSMERESDQNLHLQQNFRPSQRKSKYGKDISIKMLSDPNFELDQGIRNQQRPSKFKPTHGSIDMFSNQNLSLENIQIPDMRETELLRQQQQRNAEHGFHNSNEAFDFSPLLDFNQRQSQGKNQQFQLDPTFHQPMRNTNIKRNSNISPRTMQKESHRKPWPNTELQIEEFQFDKNYKQTDTHFKKLSQKDSRNNPVNALPMEQVFANEGKRELLARMSLFFYLSMIAYNIEYLEVPEFEFPIHYALQQERELDDTEYYDLFPINLTDIHPEQNIFVGLQPISDLERNPVLGYTLNMTVGTFYSPQTKCPKDAFCFKIKKFVQRNEQLKVNLIGDLTFPSEAVATYPDVFLGHARGVRILRKLENESFILDYFLVLSNFRNTPNNYPDIAMNSDSLFEWWMDIGQNTRFQWLPLSMNDENASKSGIAKLLSIERILHNFIRSYFPNVSEKVFYSKDSESNPKSALVDSGFRFIDFLEIDMHVGNNKWEAFKFGKVDYPQGRKATEATTAETLIRFKIRKGMIVNWLRSQLDSRKSGKVFLHSESIQAHEEIKMYFSAIACKLHMEHQIRKDSPIISRGVPEKKLRLAETHAKDLKKHTLIKLNCRTADDEVANFFGPAMINEPKAREIFMANRM